jgi:hypothetical protein
MNEIEGAESIFSLFFFSSLRGKESVDRRVGEHFDAEAQLGGAWMASKHKSEMP